MAGALRLALETHMVPALRARLSGEQHHTAAGMLLQLDLDSAPGSALHVRTVQGVGDREALREVRSQRAAVAADTPSEDEGFGRDDESAHGATSFDVERGPARNGASQHPCRVQQGFPAARDRIAAAPRAVCRQKARRRVGDFAHAWSRLDQR